MLSPETLACAELVDLVTDYLEASLDCETADSFERHVLQCPGCEAYLDQFRATIRLIGRIEPEDVDPVVLARLLDAFRGWRTP